MSLKLTLYGNLLSQHWFETKTGDYFINSLNCYRNIEQDLNPQPLHLLEMTCLHRNCQISAFDSTFELVKKEFFEKGPFLLQLYKMAE